MALVVDCTLLSRAESRRIDAAAAAVRVAAAAGTQTRAALCRPSDVCGVGCAEPMRATAQRNPHRPAYDPDMNRSSSAGRKTGRRGCAKEVLADILTK